MTGWRSSTAVSPTHWPHRCARVAVDIPRTATRWHEELAERTLDGLLDQRLRALTDHADVLAGATVGSPSDG